MNHETSKHTALIYAIVHDNTTLAETLIKDADIDINAIHVDGHYTALMWAIIRNNNDLAREILQKPDIDVNILDKHHQNTAIMIAIDMNNTEIAKKLLERADIDVSVVNFYGLTALLLAILRNNYVIANALLDKVGVDINVNVLGEGNTALLLAIKKNKPELVNKLLERADIDVNLAKQNTNNALMIAIESYKTELANKLLDRADIDVNAVGLSDQTALMIAIVYNNTEIAKKILEQHKNIDVNAVNNADKTALMLAIQNDDNEIATMLLENDTINVNIQNENGNTALMIATMCNNTEIVKKLLEKDGIEINQVDAEGNNPALMIAIDRNYTEIATMLLEQEDIEVNIVDENNESVLDHAIIRGNVGIVELLVGRVNETILQDAVQYYYMLVNNGEVFPNNPQCINRVLGRLNMPPIEQQIEAPPIRVNANHVHSFFDSIKPNLSKLLDLLVPDKHVLAAQYKYFKDDGCIKVSINIDDEETNDFFLWMTDVFELNPDMELFTNLHKLLVYIADVDMSVLVSHTEISRMDLIIAAILFAVPFNSSYKHLYIHNFTNSSLTAYSGREENNNVSCVIGIIERFITEIPGALSGAYGGNFKDDSPYYVAAADSQSVYLESTLIQILSYILNNPNFSLQNIVSKEWIRNFGNEAMERIRIALETSNNVLSQDELNDMFIAEIRELYDTENKDGSPSVWDQNKAANETVVRNYIIENGGAVSAFLGGRHRGKKNTRRKKKQTIPSKRLTRTKQINTHTKKRHLTSKKMKTKRHRKYTPSKLKRKTRAK